MCMCVHVHVCMCPLQVGVFDTAFHQTMPDTAFMYGLPYDWYSQHAIRRYGFHGTRYVCGGGDVCVWGVLHSLFWLLLPKDVEPAIH